MGNTPNEGTDNCDNPANRRPNGIQTQWGLGNFRADALAATDQFLFNGLGDVTLHNSVVGVGASLVDANHNSWAISDGQVTVNGSVDQRTANVVELAYVGGVIWCKSTANLWFAKSLPTDAWSAPVSTSPLTPSRSSSVIVSGSGELIDLNGNAWSIGGGKVLLNGVMDASTANVVEMVYFGGGEIWHKTSANAWFWKSSASRLYWSGASTPFIGVSPNTYAVTEGGGSIVDASQNVWTIVAGQVVVNGVLDAITSNVIEIAYVNGAIWQENDNFLWRAKTLPANSWLPAAGTSVKPPISASPNKTVVFPGRGSVVDANGADWTISNGKVAINGILDTTTADVVQLAYVGSRVWRKTASNLWWSKTSLFDFWAPVGGTNVAPL